MNVLQVRWVAIKKPPPSLSRRGSTRYHLISRIKCGHLESPVTVGTDASYLPRGSPGVHLHRLGATLTLRITNSHQPFALCRPPRIYYSPSSRLEQYNIKKKGCQVEKGKSRKRFPFFGSYGSFPRELFVTKDQIDVVLGAEHEVTADTELGAVAQQDPFGRP